MVDHAESAVRTVTAEIEGLRALAVALENGLRAPFAASVAMIRDAGGRVVV